MADAMRTTRLRVSLNAALCSGQFAMSIMQAMFMFYYVKVFLNVFNVSEAWFAIAQVLFMVWNSVNDPLFGYAQDLSESWMRNRRKVILYMSPFLTLAFLMLWFPWGDTSTTNNLSGWHLLCALFVYDAFYSCVNVAWSALFAESTHDPHARVTAIKYSQFAILASINIIPITEAVSHSVDNLFAFQCVGVCVGVIALACFFITGHVEEENIMADHVTLLPDEVKAHSQSLSNAYRTTKQILSKRDFLVIVITNFIHTCRSVAHLNFAAIATEMLISKDFLSKGSWQMSLFYGICTLVPQILVIASGNFIVKQGTWRVVLGSFVFSIVCGVLFWFIAFDRPVLLVIFMFLDSVAVHSIAPLFQILLADFVDDDRRRFSRAKALSSMIFSLNALIIKPAHSIAPVVVVHLLNTHGYETYQGGGQRNDDLVACMFTILCGTPALLGLLQFVTFRSYSLTSTPLNGKAFIF